MLGVYPSDQFRTTVAIYVFTRAMEVTYNLAEEEGWIWGRKGINWTRPWWFGSWILMPISSGQLLHAFVFDRECFPQVRWLSHLQLEASNNKQAYGKFILNNSPQYIQARPESYPAHLPWPSPYDVADNLAEMARLNYP